MKILYITGGLGQDGQLLSNIVSKKKFKVYYLINKKGFKKRGGVKYINLNLLNSIKLKKLFKLNKPDIILHLASNNPAFNEKNYKKFYKQNIRISYNLFNSAFNNNEKVKFISVSSSQIFKKKSGKVNEYSKKIVTTPYTKFRIEFDNFIKKKKINYSNIILFNHDSKFRNKKFLIPRIMFAIKNKNITFLNYIIKNNIHGDFSHAEDICNAIYKVILTKKKIDDIILSSNKSVSINKIISYIIKKNKLKLKLNLNNFDKKKRCLIGDNTLAKKILKWRPKKNIFLAADEIYKAL